MNREELAFLVHQVVEHFENQMLYLRMSIDNIADRLDAQNIELRAGNTHESYRYQMRQYLCALKQIKDCKTKEEFQATKDKIEKLAYAAHVGTDDFERDIQEELKK